MPDWQTLGTHLAELGLDPVLPLKPHAVGGGSVSAAWRIETSRGPLFLKTANLSDDDMLSAEAAGLAALAAADTVRVPQVVAQGTTRTDSFLALEWLDLAPPNVESDGELGVRLARLHRQTTTEHGWHRDNTIGLTPQSNAPISDWSQFFGARRLAPQLALAARNGFASDLSSGTELLDRLDDVLDDHQPPPSLLHGDLWSGNRARVDGEPVVFDPAVYFGDRETDLAMTRLFGGFSPQFYAAYEQEWPLPPGADTREALYQLYHVLNHLNLFGSGYLRQSVNLIRRVLAAA